MQRIMFKTIILLVLVASLSVFAQSALNGLHGVVAETRDGVHAGNQFRTTVYNTAFFGQKVYPPDFGGEWPINTGHIYMLDGDLFVGAEVIDDAGALQHIFTTVQTGGTGQSGEWSSGDIGPNGEPYNFMPLPGFASPDTNKLAMNKWKWAWPDMWPDKSDDPVDPGWVGSWNGYFGKNVFNADEESYFLADDYLNKEFNFHPAPNLDPERKGLGIRLYVRGFQWSNALVEDALFTLFDMENIGEYDHDKMVFGFKFGNNMGDTHTTGDSNDDSGAFIKDRDVAWLYDEDDIGGGGWIPVGCFGGAFLESPGNHYDGIDNDGDGADGSGVIIDESMFVTKKLTASDPIVVIDYLTFSRTLTSMNSLGVDTLVIPFQDITLKYWVGKTLEERPHNLIDDNLNGLIDENDGASVGEGDAQIYTYLYTGLKSVDYFSGEGIDNILLDERRDDGIDNDGDWSLDFDDLGQDGVENTGDPGEGDGMPTVGEPHFDKTDIDETDMIGLTSFTLYRWEDMPHYEDELVWDNVIPGYFDDLMENDNIELLYGSGYFPMKAGQIERFSMGIMCGENTDDFLENAKWVSRAYNENYNFAKAPAIPTVSAIAGDGRVTLYWDDLAESSYDPIGGFDFEGYRVYRSTDPGWEDMIEISDGMGSATYRLPMAQFDVDNEFDGYAAVGLKGIHFYLGDNTGISNTYVDTTAVNGQKYYYAVTSYDHGFPDGLIAPTECSKFISISTSGDIDKGANVAVVTPNPPANGYVPASISDLTLVEGGSATGPIGYDIVDRTMIQNDITYQITFTDSMDEDYFPRTESFSLVNLTSGDTLLNNSTALDSGLVQPMTEGFAITLFNDATLSVNPDSTMWMTDSSMWVPDSAGRIIHDYDVAAYHYSRTYGAPKPYDYRIDFYDEHVDTSFAASISSSRKLAASPVNYIVTNLTTGEPVKTAFYEWDEVDGMKGFFTAFTDRTRSDQIIFMEETVVGLDTLQFSWDLTLSTETRDSLHRNPKGGDYLLIKTKKPYLSHDVYTFVTKAESVDADLVNLDDIRVVPNPYVVANSWEPLNPYANGRGPRELHFTHLPADCSIKIFNVRGQLIREITESEVQQVVGVGTGTYSWDMQTKDYMDIAYGIYIYYVDAGDVGSKIGKFAVIK